MKLPILPRPGSILESRYTVKQMKEYAAKAVAKERKECATLCEQIVVEMTSYELAELIRQRKTEI